MILSSPIGRSLKNKAVSLLGRVTLLLLSAGLTHQSEALNLMRHYHVLLHQGLINNLYLTKELWIQKGHSIFENIKQKQNYAWQLNPRPTNDKSSVGSLYLFLSEWKKPIKIQEVSQTWLSEFALLGFHPLQHEQKPLNNSLTKEIFQVLAYQKEQNKEWIQEIFHADAERKRLVILIYENKDASFYRQIKEKIKWMPRNPSSKL